MDLSYKLVNKHGTKMNDSMDNIHTKSDLVELSDKIIRLLSMIMTEMTWHWLLDLGMNEKYLSMTF